ncbi:MAG: extracellular solute-binding protein [Hyphomicrobiales bacterium]|nr:extracellular solute-binding protein [Hyphomicrobiales bacterium]
MKLPQVSRRNVLKGSAALAAGALVPTAKVLAQAPPPATITPELIKAAQKEGACNYYTSIDLPLAERIARAFEAKFSGIKVRVERSGAERVFQRIGQEYGSKIHRVDVVNSSDAAHLIVWKNQGILAPFLPEDVAKHYPAEHKDADGTFWSFRVTLCPIAYNTKMIQPGEAPKSFNDLLDPKWAGKITKAHPSYSGTILTATFQVSRDLGWGYFEKLAKQKIMQLQSATDPPKKVVLGERMIAADGVEYVMLQEKERGSPLDIVYPSEGTPLIVGPNAIFKAAPNPNAARLLQAWMSTAECQQLGIDHGGLRSAHGQTKDKAGRTPLAKIKLMKDDAPAVEKAAESIKKRYSQLFGV